MGKDMSFSGVLCGADHRQLRIFGAVHATTTSQTVAALINIVKNFESMKGPAKETFDEMVTLAVNKAKYQKRSGWVGDGGQNDRGSLFADDE